MANEKNCATKLAEQNYTKWKFKFNQIKHDEISPKCSYTLSIWWKPGSDTDINSSKSPSVSVKEK